MAANLGRTVSKWFKIQLDDSGGTMRDIPVFDFPGAGITYDEMELTALQDALHGFLPGHGVVAATFTGPYSTAVAQAASGTGVHAGTTLSGSHTILNPLNGLTTPLGFAFYFGVRQPWETGEQVFGISGTAANGGWISNYQVSADGTTYTATLAMYPGSVAPAWGTVAIT